MIWHILLVIVSQFGFIFFRTLNVKYVADNGLIGAMVTGLLVNILWITTTGYGLTALYEKDWVLGIAYLVGGQIGVYYGMRKDKINEYVQNQWLNLRIVWTDLHISWFAKVTVLQGRFRQVVSVKWKEQERIYEEVDFLWLPKKAIHKFSNDITSEMINKHYNKPTTNNFEVTM